jgi:hypothetical protein
MARRQHFHSRRPKSPSPRRESIVREAPVARVPKPPVQYGAPFIVLEDTSKNTFEYANGAWVPFAMSIAQCKQSCQVKELPQKVNNKTRYEVRVPVELET